MLCFIDLIWKYFIYVNILHKWIKQRLVPLRRFPFKFEELLYKHIFHTNTSYKNLYRCSLINLLGIVFKLHIHSVLNYKFIVSNDYNFVLKPFLIFVPLKSILYEWSLGINSSHWVKLKKNQLSGHLSLQKINFWI